MKFFFFGFKVSHLARKKITEFIETLKLNLDDVSCYKLVPFLVYIISRHYVCYTWIYSKDWHPMNYQANKAVLLLRCIVYRALDGSAGSGHADIRRVSNLPRVREQVRLSTYALDPP